MRILDKSKGLEVPRLMNSRRALAELIARGDVACLQGGHVLVAELTTELLEYLSALGSGAEDLEDDDPIEDNHDRECGANDLQWER